MVLNVVLQLNNGAATCNVMTLLLWRYCSAMALQLPTLRCCCFGAAARNTAALLLSDGTITRGVVMLQRCGIVARDAITL